jgi:two-component system KDP operon response regulator KdpE
MSPSAKPAVLVIDDEPQIRRLLQITLEANGFVVHQAANGEEGILRAGMDRPEVIILDLGLPDMDGREVLKKLRQERSTPVIVLSVRNAEDDIVGSLEDGADDYLVKPFRTGELVARVKIALRHRPSGPPQSVVRVGSLDIDIDGRTVRKNGELLKLTATEFACLALLVKNIGRVLTHRYLLEQVWGPTFAEETQYLRVYVAQLRKKIEDDPSHPRLIVTESGIGYRFADQ